MDQGARFPRVAVKAGHYESFYVKACRPGGGRGVWIRHTVHKRPGAEPNASIWFTLFDREAEGPRATKATVPAAELSVPDGGWIRVADAEIGPGRARGAVGGDALTASWELSFAGEAEPCQYLPSERLYKTRLPKTKSLRGAVTRPRTTMSLPGRTKEHSPAEASTVAPRIRPKPPRRCCSPSRVSIPAG